MNTSEEVATMMFITGRRGADAALHWLQQTYSNPDGLTEFGRAIKRDYLVALDNVGEPRPQTESGEES